MWRRLFVVSGLSGLCASGAFAQPFHLPTANDALFEPGGEERFFVGTPGRSWISGAFGCVRSEGWQMHEGLDIRCLKRDEHGEPSDPVMATADGVVAYVNTKPSLSNYGIYIILRHLIDGIEVCSLYAHLSQVAENIAPGQSVNAGDVIGIMGRTANTHDRISQERAHLHFELDLLVNDRFPGWYKRRFPKQRNDHGVWNGLNLLGLDPRQILLSQQLQGTNFNLLTIIRSQPELMRVLVRKTDFPWLHLYPQLIRRNPRAEQEGIAGYELALNFNGVPYELIPRANSEIESRARLQLLSVNEAEYELRPGRKLVVRHGSHWQLAPNGERLLDLLIY